MKPGDMVGDRFELLELAGRGGMGEVYRALDRNDGSQVAVKLLHADVGEVRARFLREARLLSEIRHPGIVGHVDHGQLPNGELYLAMQWLEGEDLHARLSRGPLPIGEACALVASVADALQAAHIRNVVHRDVKPNNIFLQRGAIDQVRLLDFGVARVLHQTRAMTEAGAAIGTPSYMSPEQARGEESVDARTDVFALGCVLYECIVGEPPFVGAHALAVLAKVLFHEPAELRALVEDVPAALSTLVASMLSKDPANRPSGGAAVRDALRVIVGASLRPTPSVPDGAPRLGKGELRRLFVLIAARAATDDRHAPPALAATELHAAAIAQEQAGLEQLAREHGARIERLLDGSLVAAWTATASATDAAAQACRCALALRRLRPLDTIAVATGSGQVSGSIPSAEVIDRAATLARASQTRIDATPAIHIDESLAGLLDAQFVLQAEGSGFVLVSEREDRSVPRTLLGVPTPCVGRDRELQLLLGSVQQSIEENVARAVLVTAAAGSGKSRLRYELQGELARETNPVQVWLAHAEALGAGSPLGLIAELVRRAAGIQEGEDSVLAWRKLRARIARHVHPSEVGHTVAFLAELSGAAAEIDDAQLVAARRDARLMNAHMLVAFSTWVRAECASRPVCIVLEDLHWGDAPSVRFVEHVLIEQAEAPLCVIALARPEVSDTFPKLWERCAPVQINLPPLGKNAAQRLIEHALGAARAKDVGERIVSLAAGNAFFLEELIRAVASGQQQLPDSILAMAQARYETLDDTARQVLRAAAVFGESFWLGAVTELLPAELSDRLVQEAARLQQLELITPTPQARFLGERELRFRHALLREAAYAALPDNDKRLGHRLAAEWLIRAGERDATVLAEHCLRAEQRLEAAHHFRVGAEQALEAGDFAQALARVERALQLGAEGRERALAKAVEQEAAKWIGDHMRMAASASELLTTEAPGSLTWLRALADLSVVSANALDHVQSLESVHVDPDNVPAFVICACRVATQSYIRNLANETGRLFDRLRGLMEGVTDPSLLGWFEQARAFRAAAWGKVDVSAIALRAAAEHFKRVGDYRNAYAQQVDEAFVHLELGQYEIGLRLLDDTESEVRQRGLRRLHLLARFVRAAIRLELDMLDDAYADADFARGAYEEDNSHQLASVYDFLARIRLRQGRAAHAEELARRACALTKNAATLSQDPRGTFADTLTAQGRPAEALKALGEWHGIAGVFAESHFGVGAYLLARAEAQHALGQREAAVADLVAVHRHMIMCAAKIDSTEARASFLRRGANQRRLARLATQWQVTLPNE